MPTPVKIAGNPPNTYQGVYVGSKQTHPPSNHGPYTVGAALYLVLADYDTGLQLSTIQVWKSLDAGLTWTEQDAGNGPPILGFYNSVLNGTIIELVYCSLNPGAPPSLQRLNTYLEFDTASDTYGVPNAAPNYGAMDSNLNDGNGDLHATKLPSGDYLVIYNGGLGPVSSRLIGGVWDAAAVQVTTGIDATHGLELLQLTSDAAGTGYLIYVFFDKIAPFGCVMNLITITSGGVISAVFQISDGGANSQTTFQFSTGPPAIWQNKITVPSLYIESGGMDAPIGSPGVWEGSPVGAPVWSFKASGAVAPTPLRVFFLVLDALTGIVWWTTSGAATINIWNATYDGTIFGAAALFYNWNTDPPAGSTAPAASQALIQPIVAAVTGGYGLALAMAYEDPTISTFYIPAPSVLAVTCNSPPDGTVGDPYSHFFPATGGTPPYTWSIFAGALPDGLSLNAATGEVSGTPTLAGLFTFTVKVTDAVLDTAFVECSITINPVSSIVITPPIPPDGIIGSPYHFCIEVSGGTPPYSFVVTVGALPPGLVLDPVTGCITGTPTLPGIPPVPTTICFTVEVTDSLAASASVEICITIRPNQRFFGNTEQLVCDVRYPWQIPPEQRTPWKSDGSITAPAVGVIAQIWEYLIPDGFYLVMDRVMHGYAPVPLALIGSGEIIWLIDVNSPLGNPLATWRPVAQFTGPIGSLASGPYPVGPLQFRGGDTIRYKAIINDPAIPVGPPNKIFAVAEGWLYPVTRSGS